MIFGQLTECEELRIGGKAEQIVNGWRSEEGKEFVGFQAWGGREWVSA